MTNTFPLGKQTCATTRLIYALGATTTQSKSPLTNTSQGSFGVWKVSLGRTVHAKGRSAPLSFNPNKPGGWGGKVALGGDWG